MQKSLFQLFYTNIFEFRVRGTDLKFTSSSLDSPSIRQIRLDQNEVSECVSEEQESDVKLEGCDLNSTCPSLDSTPICSNEPDQTEENFSGSNLGSGI